MSDMTSNSITSKDNQYIKLAKALQQKKQRTEHRLFLAEGSRNTKELLQSRMEIEYVLVDSDKAARPELAALLEQAKSKTGKVFFVESRILKNAACTEENQGVIVVAKQSQYTITDFFQQTAGKNIAILDGLQDPGNVGTILRTAWAAGLGGVLLVNQAADIYNPKVVRAAMGAIYHLPILSGSNEDLLEALQNQEYHIITADAAGKSFHDFSLPQGAKAAWLLGSEGSGPSDFWRQASLHTVSIPMAEGVESLNVAVAAGILFFAKIVYI